MKYSLRLWTALLAAVACAGTSAHGQTELPQLPRCTEAGASLITQLDSATSVAGDAFTFKIIERVAPSGAYPEITAGTRGFGIVSFADHAHGSGRPGRLAVEPRFLKLADGTRVPVIADPQLAEGFVEGETRNVNGALEFVPGLNVAVSGYNALHRGREVKIERGAPFRLLIGDELATGECFVPPPSAPNVR
jgi:hypothetical protein